LAREASNWLAVCEPCHEAIEGDEAQGMAVKRWSDASYDEALHGARINGGIRMFDTKPTRSLEIPYETISISVNSVP